MASFWTGSITNDSGEGLRRVPYACGQLGQEQDAEVRFFLDSVSTSGVVTAGKLAITALAPEVTPTGLLEQYAGSERVSMQPLDGTRTMATQLFGKQVVDRLFGIAGQSTPQPETEQ